jgi:RimJ/RimL family protein N-acetyltransferase
MGNRLTQGSVGLRAITPDDLDRAWAWFQDPILLRQLDAAPAVPRTRAALETQWLAGDGRDAVRLAVVGGDPSSLVGLTALDGILWNQRVGWLTLVIGPPHQGRGYGRAAIRLILALAFGELNLRRVQLTVFPDNHRAIHLYEEAGFQAEGRYREFLDRDGAPFDMLLYGLLRREWTP